MLTWRTSGMDASAALDACNIQQKQSGSDAESTEHALLMPVQLLNTGGANPTLEGQAVAEGPLTSGYGRDYERMQCQVADCDIDLRTTKPYCIKKRLCPEHLTAHAVRRRGIPKGFWRFCQQCGKLEPLESFDGTKRSCRARLQKRRAHNTQRSADPWKAGSKHKGQNYKAKQLQRQKQDSAGQEAATPDDDDDGMNEETDGDDDELQYEAMQDEEFVGAAAAVAAAAAGGGGGYHGYGLPGGMEMSLVHPAAASPAYAGGAAAAGNHPAAGNYQQQQHVYQSSLYNAAMAAATAGGVTVMYTGTSASQRSAAALAAAAAAAAAPVSEDALHTLHKVAESTRCDAAVSDDGGNHHLWHSRQHNSTAEDSGWPSSRAADPSQYQQQQQLEQEQEGPSPESIAATLAAMAAVARHRDQQQQQVFKQEHLVHQSPSHPEQQHWRQQQTRKSLAEAAAAVYGSQQNDAAGSRSPCKPPSATVSNQQQQQAQQFVYGNSPQGIADYEYNGRSRHHADQQQQQQDQYVTADRMEVDAAAAAAAVAPAAPPAAANRARMLAAAAAAAAAAMAADARDGQSSPSKRHQKLQSLLGRLIEDMVPQADAAATLAAMRSQPPPTSSARAASAGPKDSPDYRPQQQQQQLQLPALLSPATVAAHAVAPTAAGSSPTASGSSTHAEQAAAAVTIMQQQPQQLQPEALPSVPESQATTDIASSLSALLRIPAQSLPATLQRGVQAKSTAAPTKPAVAAVADLPQQLAASAGAKEPGNAAVGLGAVEGLGMLLSAGLNSMLGQQGQSGSAGSVQLLAGVLTQAPTAAATLLLAQQQQLQQLQAQQQQLVEQLARREQQQQEQYNTLMAAVAEAKLSRASQPAMSHFQGSEVTANVVQVVRDQLQALSRQVADSLAPLQGQVDELQAELATMKSVVQTAGLQSELNRIKAAINGPLHH